MTGAYLLIKRETAYLDLLFRLVDISDRILMRAFCVVLFLELLLLQRLGLLEDVLRLRDLLKK